MTGVLAVLALGAALIGFLNVPHFLGGHAVALLLPVPRAVSDGLHRLKALGYDLPSLSVNDSVIVGDRIFHVERVGFVETTVAKVEGHDAAAR